MIISYLMDAPVTQFDWEGDMPLKLPQEDLVIYEMHLRGFTKHDSSKVQHPGTYASATEKLHHLKVLSSFFSIPKPSSSTSSTTQVNHMFTL